MFGLSRAVEFDWVRVWNCCFDVGGAMKDNGAWLVAAFDFVLPRKFGALTDLALAGLLPWNP